MGKGNPHRPRKTGKGTRKAWQGVGLEGEPISSQVFAQQYKKEPRKNVIDFLPRKSVKADSVHFGSSVSNPVKKRPVYRTGPTPETAKRKPTHEISVEERIAALEDDIGEFGDGERRYVRKWVDIYPNELQQAIYNREKKGERITDKAVAAIRLSLINHIAKWGMDRGIAPEKSNLIEKYLELKLPHGVPPKTAEELHLGEREAIKKIEKERAREETDLFMKKAADARQAEIDAKLPGRGTQVDESLKDLNTKNKHMEIKDIRKQLEQDREELRKAKMLPEESFPAGAGFMGAPVDLDAREAEEVKARRTGTEDKKEKEPEFSPEEAEEIKKIAHLISERRMTGKDDAAKKWQADLAKEYGLDENAFSKEAIEKLLSDNGLGDKHWTPEAQKFMQDWDLGKAEEAFRNMKKAGEQTPDQDSGSKTSASPDKTPMEDALKKQAKENQRQIDNKSVEDVRIKGRENAEEARKIEFEAENSLEALKADLDAKADAYAIARGNARGSRGYLAKLLGMSKKGFSENIEEMEEVKAARLEYLQAKLEHSKAATESAFKEYQDKLQGGTASPEELEILRIKWEAIGNYHNRASDIELQGKFVEKTVEYYKTKGGPLGKVFGKYLDLYNNVYLKKVPPKVRAAISIAMLGGAVAGLAGAFGVTGIFVGAASVVSKPVRFFLAPLFPAMTYTGTGKMIEKGLQWKYAKKGKERSAAFGEVVGKMKSGEASIEETRKNILKLLEEQNKECGDDLVNRGWWEDRWEQVRNLLTTVVGARATMVLMSGTEAIGSFFEGKGNVAGVAGVSPKGAPYTQGPGGKTIITPEGMKAVENSGTGSANLSPEEYEKIGKHPYFSEPEAQTPEIAKPQFEEIDSVKIKTGGSMWKGIENSIRANPEAYHLDSKDPNFRKIMNGKIAEMLHTFADKKGLSYEQLDKVFADDTFKLMHDSITGKFYLDDYQGKAFGGDVSRDGAGAVQENVPSKGSVPVEHTRPRTGAVDHQPSRGGGKTMQYDSDTPAQKIAKEHYAQAVQNQENLNRVHAEQAAYEAAETAKNNSILYIKTRGLANLIVNEAGVGNRANFWEHSMDNWKNLLGSEYQISQDVQFNDATNKTNISLNKLRSLYPILEKYHRQGIESIGDCLKEAVKNPTDLLKINKLVLRK